jgi:hypothetical protein
MFLFGAFVTYDLLRHQFLTRDFLESTAKLEVYEKPPGEQAA